MQEGGSKLTSKPMSDQEFFESNKTLENIISPNKKTKEKTQDNMSESEKKKLYDEIMSKPLLTGDDILDLPYEPNDYVIENFLWRNDIAFIIAREKSGKSVFSFQMAQAITVGEPFLDAFDVARPMNVLYVQAEGTMGETQDRITKSLKKINWDPKRWRHHFPPALSLDTDEGYDDLVRRIDEDTFNPDIIFIDPVYMAMDGDLSDNKASRTFCRNVRKIKAKFDCSVICVHHEHREKKNPFGKAIEEGDESVMGSFVWKAFASHTLRIVRDIKAGTNKVTCERSRSGDVIKEITLAFDNESETFMLHNTSMTQGAENNILKVLKTCGGSSAAKLTAETGIPEGTVRNAFSTLKKKGLIEVKNKKGKEVIYGVI